MPRHRQRDEDRERFPRPSIRCDRCNQTGTIPYIFVSRLGSVTSAIATCACDLGEWWQKRCEYLWKQNKLLDTPPRYTNLDPDMRLDGATEHIEYVRFNRERETMLRSRLDFQRRR